MEKIMVGMSGGVDSAVSAYLLKKEGHGVAGVNCSFFRPADVFIEKESTDAADAKNTADMLGIPFFRVYLGDKFRTYVIEDFINAYREGATPNPCISCNKHLKFGELLTFAESQGYENIATGHYARIEKQSDRYLLKKGAYKEKDQSYVLWCLTQKQLSHTRFPLGEFSKAQVREIADSINFSTARKQDSQDICFIPDGDYAAFIEKYSGLTFPEGDFVTTDGRRLGTHKGIIRYTVGQRKGLGLALPAPMYVKEKDVANNRVILCDNETLFTRELTAKNINFIPFDKLTEDLRAKAKVRYKHEEQWATVSPIDENRFRLVFDEPQRAIAKGQSVVLYDGDYVVGGGIIE